MKNSRYSIGGTTETTPGFYGWWEKKEFIKDSSDVVYYLEKKYENRPDLLSYTFYEDVSLWWLICQYNDIVDPFEELKEGKRLLIPSLDRLLK